MVCTYLCSQAFPGLDLVRAALLSPASQPLLLDKEVLDKIFSACLGHLSREYPVPCQMLSLRALCNLFSSQQGRELLATYRDSVVSRVFEQVSSYLLPCLGKLDLAGTRY